MLRTPGESLRQKGCKANSAKGKRESNEATLASAGLEDFLAKIKFRKRPSAKLRVNKRSKIRSIDRKQVQK